MDASDSEWLEEFLNVYWLRPENALWRAINCRTLDDIDFQQPSLDLSCGDGIFSFILAGGKFDSDFDVFRATDNLENFFENEDIYDSAPSNYSPTISKKPDYSITVGTDWKKDLLDKAEALDFYEELIQHDNNEPLPFDDNQFMTIFSNSVYWVDNLELHLEEIKRVLHPDGEAILILKTQSVKSFLRKLWENYEEELGEELIDMIDRGRSDNYSHLYDDEGWSKKIEDAGFKIKERRSGITTLHARMWDIGLRPISPYLIEMSSSLETGQRTSLKKDWIETWTKMLQPFNETNLDILGVEGSPEIIYVLEKESCSTD